jgi:hypothetical protein
MSLKNAALALCLLVTAVLASSQAASAASQIYLNAAGTTQNVGIYGSTWNGTTVTSWGGNYRDYGFRLLSSGNVTLADFELQITANKGQNTAANNPLRATWFSGNITASANYTTALGTAVINSASVSTSFETFLIGPGDFGSGLFVTPTPAVFTVRLWAEGNNANAGYGTKLSSNPELQYYSTDPTVSVEVWNGSSWVTASTFNPVPESSTALLLIGPAVLGLLALRKKRREPDGPAALPRALRGGGRRL